MIVGLRDALSIECVGRDNVGTSLQIAFEDILNHIRARQVQGVVVAFHLTRHIFKKTFPEVLFLKAIFLDDGAHGTIQY